MSVHLIKIFLNIILIIPIFTYAIEEAQQTFGLSGTLYQSGTTNPLFDSNTKILIQILNPDKTCLLYEEQQVVNVGSTGYFNIQVGSAKSSNKRTLNDPKQTMANIFQNAGMIFGNNLQGANCIGGIYMPNPGDTRYVRITVTPSSTNVPDRLVPDIAMNSTPSALVAQSVQGLERNRILQVKESESIALNQSNIEWLFNTTNYTNLQTILTGGLVAGSNSGVALPSISSNPSSPIEGSIWYDSVNKVIKYSNGTTTNTLGSGGAGVSSITVGSNLTTDGNPGGTLSAPGIIDLKNSGVTAGTYAKVTVNTKGLVTGSTTLAEADIPTLSTAGKVSASAINTGTIGGNASINTTGAITTTNTVTSNNISTNAIYAPSINGGSTASASLTLDSTSHATKGNVLINPTNGNVGIGTASPGATLDVKGTIRLSGSTSGFTGFQPAAAAGSTVWTLPTADGSSGQILTTNGSGILSWSTATSGALTSLNGQTGGTQTFATPGTTGTAPNWSSATNAHTLNIPMASTATVTAGLISKTDYDNFNTKLSPTLTSAQIFVGNGSNVATGVAMSGDASITNAGAVTVNKVKGVTVSSTAPSASGQVLRYDGTSSYVPAFLSLADIRSTVTPANTMFPASTCTAAQTMTWSSLTDTMTCSNIAISNTAVSGLGTAATLNVGTGINNIVQLDGSSKLPAVDGSALTNISVSASNITTGTLAVANGGTGTTDGSITGTGALTYAAGGTNQNVTLTPSGTGYTVLNGSVGIGTATPLAKLDVNGTIAIANANKFYLKNSSGSLDGAIYEGATNNLNFNVASGGNFYFNNNAGTNNWMSLNNSNMNFTGDYNRTIDMTRNSTANTSGNYMSLVASGSTVNSTDKNGGDLKLSSGISTGMGGSDISFLTATPQASTSTTDNTPTAKLVIKGSGNVGIGTTTPTDKLEVFNGDAIVTGDNTWAAIWVRQYSATKFPEIVLSRKRGSYATPAEVQSGNILGSLSFRNSSSNEGANVLGEATENHSASAYGSALIFQTIPNTTITPLERMRIDQNGNVGVGTATPGAPLDVKGEIRLSGSTSGYTGFQPAAVAGSTVWTLPTADGSSGQVLTTNGSGILSWSTATSGALTSLNGQTGGTQTFATPGTTGTAPNWSSATNAHTLNIPMASTATVTAGLISKTDYDAFNSKLTSTLTSAQIFVGNGSNVATGVAMSGDASIDNTGAVSVDKIKSKAVSSTAPSASGQVLRYDGTSTYIPAFLSLADIRSTVTPTNTMFPASTCTTAQTMTWSSLTDTMTCSNIAISNTAVSGLGTAATLNVGTGNNNIVQLDGSAKLPAVDGSQLTNISVSASSVSASAGTEAAPSITFTGDTDTGWWHPAANTIAASTGGVERIRIDSTGAIGIGGTPGATDKLLVYNNDTSSVPSNVYNFDFQLQVNPAAHATGTTKYSIFSYTYTPNSATKNVGTVRGVAGISENYASVTTEILTGVYGQARNDVGTTDTVSAGDFRSFVNGGTVTDAIGLNVRNSTTGGATTNVIGLLIGSGTFSAGTITNRYGVKIDTPSGGTPTNDYGIYQQSTTQKNFFGGNVGIGVTTPSSKVQIAGSNSTTINVANEYLHVGGSEQNLNGYRLIGFGYKTSETYSPAYVGFQDTSVTGSGKGDLVFGTSNSTTDIAPSERMRIDSAGNVGIGTNSPSSALEVRGEIKTTDSTGANRLWGQGRPGATRYGTVGVESGLCTNGSVSFGLSYAAAAWDSAAAACPSGTWVCTATERGTAACDTARPDSGSADRWTPAGAAQNDAANAHYGWLSDVGSTTTAGQVSNESGTITTTFTTANAVSVWCCN